MTQDALDLFHLLNVAREAAREAGVVLKSMLDSATVSEKSNKDLVTDADVAAQQVIQAVITKSFPDHAFVGEEADANKDLSKLSDRLCWVVDPIDGTANYVHRLNNFAVSIAVAKGMQSLVGVVYDPMSDEMFTAVKGHGAWLNDRRIKPSKCVTIDKALIAASFPPDIRHGAAEIDQFVNVLVASQSIRRLGSAALNLCFVACGRLDGYWASKVRSWDIAAGVLIGTEAGITLTTRNGKPFDLSFDNLTVASTPQLHGELLSELGLIEQHLM
jgi:myo-inositol-1(or 4)-monophosphatase